MQIDVRPVKPPIQPDVLSAVLDGAPFPTVITHGRRHIVRYVNPAFCRLIGQTKDEILEKSFSDILPQSDERLALLDQAYHSGRLESPVEDGTPKAFVNFPAWMMWPVMGDEHNAGVMLQITPRHEKTLAMNEALVVGSIRQHELTAAAEFLNIKLEAEIAERKQRERDALALTDEIAHRVKNNLQIVVSLIAAKARSAPRSSVQGYVAIQTRVSAIAELYDLISRASQAEKVALDAYLRQIGRAMSASVLEDTSDIKIDVIAEALDIDRERAVPFGLLVNELTTNAIKHAFPGGAGRIALKLERIGDEIELTIADDGVGLKDNQPSITSGKHGADYVAVFVRQLGGKMSVSTSLGIGTTVKIRIPSVLN